MNMEQWYYMIIIIFSRKHLISKFGVESIIEFYEKKSETISIIDVCNSQNANIFFSFHLKRNL
jgi:hypothetical protein